MSNEMKQFIERLCESKNYSHWEKDFLIEAAEKGLTVEQLELVSNASASVLEMKEIADGILKGLTMEQLNVFARRDLNVKEMRILKEGLLEGRPVSFMNTYAQNMLQTRYSFYQSAMKQFAIECHRLEKENHIVMDKTTKDKAFHDVQLAVSKAEAGIQAFLTDEVRSIIQGVLEKKTEQKKGLNDKIHNAEERRQSVKTERFPRTKDIAKDGSSRE